MLPPPAAAMPGATRRAANTIGRRLRAKRSSQNSGVISSRRWRRSSPALLTSARKAPQLCPQRPDCGQESIDVADVGDSEARSRQPLPLQPVDQRRGLFLVDVEEAHEGALP